MIVPLIGRALGLGLGLNLLASMTKLQRRRVEIANMKKNFMSVAYTTNHNEVITQTESCLKV